MCTRRTFLASGASCLAHVASMSLGSAAGRRLWALGTGSTAAQQAWGRLEPVADGVWALISTPLQDRTTLCNGGIVAGRDGVLVVESFASPEGALWMARQARALTGRWPTHVVVTHYHGDHSGGLEGLADPPEGALPSFRLTDTTRRLVQSADERREGGVSDLRRRTLGQAVAVPAGDPETLDLGAVQVQVTPRDGHTASDVTVELDDPSVVFCGDLVWNEMFPNYVDAVPSQLSRSVRALRRGGPGTTYVPGHGPLADGAALDRYLAVLDHVEEEARRAFERGDSASEAAADFTLPPGLGEWFLFNPGYFERALAAWERELTAP